MKKCIECGKPTKEGDAFMCAKCHRELIGVHVSNGLTAKEIKKLKPMCIITFDIPDVLNVPLLYFPIGLNKKELEIVRAKFNEFINVQIIKSKFLKENT